MKYLYKCDKYNHITEHEFPMGENPEIVLCGLEPEEGGKPCGYTARRYIGEMAPVRFNGTGFASTDIPRKSGLEGYYS